MRTPGRVAAGRRYAAWLASPQWRRRRSAWAREERRRHGGIVCAVCGRPWSESSGDLHHLDYSRIGGERHEDLMAMCRRCHESVHRAIDASRVWQRLIARGCRRSVTLAIVARLGRAEEERHE